MDLKIDTGPDVFDMADWSEMAAKDANAHIFSLPDWHRIWWDEFGAGKQLEVLTFLDPHPVAIAPLMYDDTEEGRRVRFLGGDDLTDYLGPVVGEEGKLPAVAEALIAYMKQEAPHWDVFDAKCLPVPFRFAEWLVEAADRMDLRFTIDDSEVTAVLPLPATFDDYFEALPGKKRHELRRKLRRFSEICPDARVVTATDETLAADVLSFVDLHKGSGGLKGKFFLPERATFFARVAQEFQPLGLLSLDFVESAGRRVAATFSYRHMDTFYLYNSAYDPELRAAAPGLTLVSRLIERSIDQGLTRFDFLRGSERYKFDLGAQRLPLHGVKLTRA